MIVVIAGLFYGLVAALVVLHLLVYVTPAALVRFNALPWAFRWDKNLDLDFQTVTYAAVHDLPVTRWSHVTIPLEQVAWAVVLAGWHPALLVLVGGILTLQARALPERPFAWIVVPCWTGLAAAGVVALTTWGPAATTAAQLLLLLGPIVRFIGHTFEPIPPWVGQPRDAFVSVCDARFGWRLPLLPLSGTISEAAAALPFRLVVVQLSWLAQVFGYQPRVATPWAEARALGARIRERGWAAYPGTARLFADFGAERP